MGEYFRYLKSDIYKLRHSWFFALHLFFAALGAALTTAYSVLSSADGLTKLAAFAQMVAIAFPFTVSAVCQTVAEQESRAGRFQNMLTLPKRKITFFSKLTVLLLSGLLAAVLTALLFGLPFSYFSGTKLPVSFFVLLPIILWACSIMLYVLHLILAIRFGKALGMSVGVMGSLLSALLMTELGRGLWYVTPYGLGVRFAGKAILYLFDFPTVPDPEIKIGIIFCSLLTCGIIGFGAIWFSRYDGKVSE